MSGFEVRHTVGIAIAAALAVSLVAAPAAPAGTYRVAQCYPEFGASAADAIPFDNTGGDHYREVRDCNQTEGFTGLKVVHAAQSTSGARDAGWLYTAPPGTAITGIWSEGNGLRENVHVPELTAVAPSGAHDWMGPDDGGQEKPYFWTGGKFPDAAHYRIALQCVAAEGETCGQGPNAYVSARRTILTLDDRSAPQVSGVGGGLLAPTSVRGAQAVTIDGADAGSGLAAASVLANGAGAASHAFDCTTGAHQGETLPIRLAPCPPSGGATLTVDTAAPPFHQGLNRVQLCLADLATQGLPGIGCAERDVRVDNACPVAGAAAADVELDFGRGDRLTRTTRFGSKVVIRGRAVDATGVPVPNAEVCLAQRNLSAPYADEGVADTATSGGKGGFRLRVPAGPSRALRIAHWPPSGAPVERFAKLRVHANPRLRASDPGRLREGDAIRFRASLNPPFAASRKVRIEAKAKAGWVGVPGCRGRSDERRAFGCRWKVPRQAGDGGYALRFRAFVPRQEGYPYLSGASRAKELRVGG